MAAADVTRQGLPAKALRESDSSQTIQDLSQNGYGFENPNFSTEVGAPRACPEPGEVLYVTQ